MPLGAPSVIDADPFVLLAVAELRAREIAVEVGRLRAAGLMLRNRVPALLLALLVAAYEAVAGSDRPAAAASAALLLLGSYAAARRGQKMRKWAVSKTLEIAYWVVPAVELATIVSPAGAARQAPGPRHPRPGTEG